MTAQLHIAFKNLATSPWVEEVVKQQLEKLERIFKSIIMCRVVAQVPHKSHHVGNDFEVTLHIHVPDHEIVVSRKGTHDVPPHAVVIQAFEAAKRQLEDWKETSRGYVKTHGPQRRSTNGLLGSAVEREAPSPSTESGNLAVAAETGAEIDIEMQP